MGITTKEKKSQSLLGQIIEMIPENILRESIHQHQADKYCSKYKTYDQLVSFMFGQLAKCNT